MLHRSPKIVLVLNYSEREQARNEKIRSAILDINSYAKVYIFERCSCDLIMEILEIDPDVIMVLPFTAKATSYPFYILKYLLDCPLACFRTEGIFDINLPGQSELMAGIENYGDNLVDYETFWGRKVAEGIGRVLVEQGKLSSANRCLWLGCPSFEDYVRPNGEFEKMLPDYVSTKLNQYPRERRILIVTGFQYADYSREDVINAGDLVDNNSKTFQKNLEEALLATLEVRRFRQAWIDTIIESARSNPQMLFVVKTHPCEIIHYRVKNIKPYEIFRAYDNILLINEAISIGALISNCSVVFHYGSTTMLEAYLLKVPSVFLTCNELKANRNIYNKFQGIGISSTISADINDAPSIISGHAADPILFEHKEDVETYLEDMLNLKIGQDYRPSEKIGRFLLSLVDEHPQAIAADDKYLVNAYEQSGGHNWIKTLISKAVKSINDGDFQRALTIYLDKVVKLVKIMITFLEICLYL